jgi:transcriptional regulator with XRE-family HTH domain
MGLSEEPGAGRVHPLRRERTLRGWSQQYVAEAIEAPDASYVSRWERGVVSPSPYYRERLCRLFGRNAEELGLLDLPREDEEAAGGPVTGAGRPPHRLRVVALAAGLAAAVAAVAVVAGVLRHGPAPPATGGDSTPTLYGCEPGWYCFYATTGFGGRRLNFRDCGGRQSLENYGFGLQASSWVNTTRHTVFVYDGAGVLLWKEEPRSASSEVGASRDHRAAFFETVC